MSSATNRRLSGTDELGMPFYDREAETYDETRFGSRSGEFAARFKNEVIVEALRAEGAFAKGKCVLDAASGTGRVAHALLEAGECMVQAADLSPKMLQINESKTRGETRKRIRFETADLSNLPFNDDSFDAAILASFLYLVPVEDYRIYFGEMARVVKPGGVVVVEAANTFVLNPKNFVWILLHKYYRRRSVKSYVHAWQLGRLLEPLVLVDCRGSEYPRFGRGYASYRRTSRLLRCLFATRSFGGKLTAIARVPAGK